MMHTNEKIIEQTKVWIHKVVIGCNFCPFAAKAMSIKNSIHFVVVRSSDHLQFDDLLLQEFKYMDENADVETGFIIFADLFKAFDDFLEVVDLGDWWLEENGYVGKYQFANFHPEYQFAETELSDPANYTNRSLFPMLQILKEESVEKARHDYPDIDSIPTRNIEFAKANGIQYMQTLRDSCFS